MKQQRRVLSQAEAVSLADALRQVCRTDDKGFAVYDETWNDDRIASTLLPKIPGITGDHVATMRRSLIGSLVPVQVRAPSPEKIEQQVQAAVDARTKAATILVNNLGGRVKELEEEVERHERVCGRHQRMLEAQANTITKLQSQVITLYERLGEKPDA